MALIKDDTRVRLDIPHEPGEWIEIRPMRNSDLRTADLTDRRTALFSLMDTLIVAWSYPEPVTPENIAQLDVDTTRWLDEQIPAVSGIRADEAKNGSSPSS